MALNGTYKTISESQFGKTEAIFHFKTEGNVLTGTNEVMGQTLTIQDGKIDGNSFEFKEKMDSPMGATEFTFKGTFDGDNISGNIITQMGTTPFKGSRIG
ncbi:MAG: hypothetical protein GX254_10605 [Clostridiales bacterium]|jgi:hypothetical protein|nr:hypothetical protein [Clostridiales bacterium]